MNKKLKRIMLLGIGIIPIAALGDVWLIGSTSFINYIYICAWEYLIFWTGLYYGIKYSEKKEVGRK